MVLLANARWQHTFCHSACCHSFPSRRNETLLLGWISTHPFSQVMTCPTFHAIIVQTWASKCRGWSNGQQPSEAKFVCVSPALWTSRSRYPPPVNKVCPIVCRAKIFQCEECRGQFAERDWNVALPRAILNEPWDMRKLFFKHTFQETLSLSVFQDEKAWRTDEIKRCLYGSKIFGRLIIASHKKLKKFKHFQRQIYKCNFVFFLQIFELLYFETSLGVSSFEASPK